VGNQPNPEYRSSRLRPDRLLGVEAETVVITAYHITRDFDVVLKEQQGMGVRDSAGAPRRLFLDGVSCGRSSPTTSSSIFNDRGLLLPTEATGASGSASTWRRCG
jgi:hypothetical protein